MTTIFTKALLSILLTILVAIMIAIFVYWVLTMLTFTTALLGFTSLSEYFKSSTIAFTAAIERAYKSVRFRK